MKCELCNHATAKGNRLCQPCAEAIQRLVVISQRPEECERPLAETIKSTNGNVTRMPAIPAA